MKISKELSEDVSRLHAQVCGGLADPTRILILYILSEGDKTVSDIVNELDVNQPTVSRHLQVLRNRSLVTAHRDGVNIRYSLADRRIIEALNLLRGVMADQYQKRANLISLEE